MRESDVIPYSLRTLAIETLIAVVTKKEGSRDSLSIIARQINILGELGVGKGQYPYLVLELWKRPFF